MDNMKPSEGRASASGLRGRTVALVGADGAGKSTVARLVVERLPFDAEYLYMGVNLEASTVMLPTTRLVLAVKRRRGRRPDMTVPIAPDGQRPSLLLTARRLVRMTNWIAEEAYRAVLSRRIQQRGGTVIFDRHFFCDYHAAAVAPSDVARSLDVRIHGHFLDHWYPRPDLTLFLDAPPAVLVARKHESTIDAASRRRAEFLALGDVLPAFQVVDADRDVEEVVEDVLGRIVTFVSHPGTALASDAVPPADDRDATLVALPTDAAAATGS
jgi:thymidylate kinase